MSMFAGLEETPAELDVDKVEDTVGGGFEKIETTGMYEFTIKKAWADKSEGGAFNINLQLETDKGARLNLTEYITSGTAKGCKNYYIDKKGNKQFLPSYIKISQLDSLLGFSRTYPKTELATVMIYDYNEKKEVPQEKEIVKEWIGKQIKALVVKKIEDKYSNPSESRTVFEVDYFLDFNTGKTRNEIVSGSSGFAKKWLEKKDKDFVIDKRDKSKNYKPTNNRNSLGAVPEVDTDDCEIPF